MEKLFFTMKPQKKGQMPYILLCLIPFVLVGIVFDWMKASCLLCFLIVFLLISRNRMVVVFNESIIEKKQEGSRRFIRKIQADQFCSYRRNILGEIILLDADGKKLLCIEPFLSNRECLLEWLASHHINIQVKE